MRTQFTRCAAVLLLASAGAACAVTNFFPEMAVGDRTYTNATVVRVTAADLILRFEGGGARVALSNLPPDLQRQFGYDPDKAEAALAERRKQRAAFLQRQAALAAQATAMDQARTVRVFAVVSNAGTPRCKTDVGEIWLKTLPPATAQYLASRLTFEGQISALSRQLDANTRQLRIAEALAPPLPDGPEWYVEALSAQRVRLNQLRTAVASQTDALQQLRNNLQTLTENGDALTRVVAARTAQKYLGLEVWQCAGVAPPPPARPQEESAPEGPNSDAAAAQPADQPSTPQPIHQN